MKNSTTGSQKYLVILGSILIIGAALCNEWLLVRLLCPDAAIEQRYLVNLRIAQIILAGIGLALIIFRKKETAVNLSILLLTLIMIFAGTEAFFRFFLPQITGASEHQKLFEYHNELGWQLIPGKTGVYISKHEFKNKITVNSAGMRDIEYSPAKPAGIKRIVLLGDSFTSSMGVDLPDAFSEIMENKLLKNTQVLNFGVNGYGPAQELLILEKRVISYRPDLVVMVIFVGNDFDDISGISDWIDGYIRPRAVTDENGHLHFTGIPVPLSDKHRAFQQLKKSCAMPRSHFIDFFDKILHRNKLAIEYLPGETRLGRIKTDAQTLESYRLMNAILRETNSFCKRNGASFMVAVAPSIIQVYDRIYWKEIVKRYALHKEDYDLLLPNKKITAACNEAGIPMVDLTPELKEAVLSGRDTYYAKNQHWNKAGEQIVAEVLSRFIVEHNLL